ncbi:MAG: DUF7544 domain-containing protein [Candidatus Angelobacter sp.]
MNHLSAIDAFGPAFARVGAMLFRPFRLGAWLKIGLIGLLGGGAVVAGGGFNFRFPVSPRNAPHGGLPPETEDIYRAVRSIHLADYFHVFVIVVAVIVVFALIFLYLFCRFRFILFDSVVTGQAAIGPGWRKYESQANRYFGFWLVFRLVNWGVMVLIVGVPLWKAYKSGVFSGDNSLPAFFAIFASIALAAIAASIIFAIVSTLAKDFVMPVLALDDLSLGDAWSAVLRVVASEPGAWAAYMGLKLLCAIGSSLVLSVAFILAMIPAAILIGIPVGILVLAGVLAFKTVGVLAGIIICGIAGLLALAGFFCLLLILTAPVSVFFASYAFYFFGGRYPKLAAVLLPQPVPPPPQPQIVGVRPAL